jgi:hypothetical protein
LAYDASQRGVCQCCRTTMLWCKCKQKCFRNTRSCMNECRVSLGCFDNVCRPATPEECPPP